MRRLVGQCFGLALHVFHLLCDTHSGTLLTGTEQECSMPADPIEAPTGKSEGDDAAHWNSRYSEAHAASEISPPELVALIGSQITPGTRALDIACGLGDGGLFLAQNSAEVTFLDVSRVALNLVGQRATAAGLAVTTKAIDLRHDAPPTGPFDLITCVHYLDRPLLATIGQHLTVGGRLVVAIATTTNLERHPRPSARFLLHPGELPTLVPNLEVMRHDEDWRSNGVHEAWLIAQRCA